MRTTFIDYHDANEYFRGTEAERIYTACLRLSSRAFPHDIYRIEGRYYFETRDENYEAITLNPM